MAEAGTGRDGAAAAAAAAPPPGQLSIAALVQKVSAFRTRLVAEQREREAAEARAGAAEAELKKGRAAAKRREAQLVESLRENARLREEMHMIRVEPLPHQLEASPAPSPLRTSASASSLGDAASGGAGGDEVDRLRRELELLRFHHEKLSERSRADQVESEHSRLLLQSELAAVRSALGEAREEAAAARAETAEARRSGAASSAALLERVERAERDAAAAAQEVARAKKATARREREAAALREELAAAKEYAEVYARKAYEMRARLQQLELQIQRHFVWRVRPFAPPAPAELLIKKIASTGQVLLCVAPGGGEEEVRQDLRTVVDVHAVAEEFVAPPTGCGRQERAASEAEDEFRRLVRQAGVADGGGGGGTEEGEQEGDAGAADDLRRFCVVFRHGSRHACRSEDDCSATFQAASPEERDNCVASLRALMEVVREPSERASQSRGRAVAQGLESFF